MNFKNTIKKFEKLCYQPITEHNEDLNYPGSKYYGNIWIPNNEKWPQTDEGDSFTFIYQLDIATLPEEYKTLLGGKGVLQFFYDFDNYEDGELARIVYPNEDGAYHTQPYTKKVYLIDNKKPQQQIIKSWKSHIDYPFTSEEFEDDEEMCDLWNEICDHEKFDEDKYITISGDKLGGYALFSQAGYPSNGLIYQIQFDEDNEHIEESKNGKEQRNLKSHAPNLISSDGTCFLFIEEFEDDDGKISTEFTFDWACG